MCDGNWECPNGQDEVACRECDHSETLVRCPGDLFFTKENRCLPIEYICDGVSGKSFLFDHKSIEKSQIRDLKVPYLDQNLRGISHFKATEILRN